MRACCAAMPDAALYMPSSNGWVSWKSPAPATRSSRISVGSAGVVGRPRPGLRARWTFVLGGRADLGGGLLQRGVDRLDRLLAGLVGAHRGHHVDHRAGRVDARALQRAGAHGAGRLAGGGAGEVRVAGLAGAVDGEHADLGRVDGPVGGHADRLAALVEDLVAELVDEQAGRARLERAVARV